MRGVALALLRGNSSMVQGEDSLDNVTALLGEPECQEWPVQQVSHTFHKLLAANQFNLINLENVLNQIFRKLKFSRFFKL